MPSKVASVSASGGKCSGHCIFHNAPGGRDDFCTLTKTSVFPLLFRGHRWIENLPVVNRAIAVWPMIVREHHFDLQSGEVYMSWKIKNMQRNCSQKSIEPIILWRTNS